MYSSLRKHETLPGPWSKFFHDGLPFFLYHVTMHGRHCKVSFPHLLCQPINLYKSWSKMFTIKRFLTHKHAFLTSYYYMYFQWLHFHFLNSPNLPFSLCYRIWQLVWWSEYHRDHRVYQTSTPLSQQPQRTVWCLLMSTHHCNI